MTEPPKTHSMSFIPFKDGEPAPRGRVFVQIQTPQGVVAGWALPSELPKREKKKRSSLTPEQRKLSHAIFRKVSKYVPSKTESEWDSGFEEDVNPRFELSKWERLATVFHEERSQRPKEQHKTLFRALLMAISGMQDVGTIISMDPALKAIPNLSRAMSRMEQLAREQGVDT